MSALAERRIRINAQLPARVWLALRVHDYKCHGALPLSPPLWTFALAIAMAVCKYRRNVSG